MGPRKSTPISATRVSVKPESDGLKAPAIEFDQKIEISDVDTRIVEELSQQEEASNLLDTVEEGKNETTSDEEKDQGLDAISLAALLNNEEIGEGKEE
jgi:hypothetical protein